MRLRQPLPEMETEIEMKIGQRGVRVTTWLNISAYIGKLKDADTQLLLLGSTATAEERTLAPGAQVARGITFDIGVVMSIMVIGGKKWFGQIL